MHWWRILSGWEKNATFHEDINGSFGERVFVMIVGSFHTVASCCSRLEMLCWRPGFVFPGCQRRKHFRVILVVICFTPALRCQRNTRLDFPCYNGSEERNGSAGDKQCVKKFLTAYGMQGRRKSWNASSLLLWKEFYYDGGYFFTLAWRGRGLALPSNIHSHSVALHPVCMSVCMWEMESVSVGGNRCLRVSNPASMWARVCL